MKLIVDYGDITCDKAFIGYFPRKLESIQYNGALEEGT